MLEPREKPETIGSAARPLRRRLYEILEQATPSDRASKIVDRLIILFIVVNLATMVLESDPSLNAVYGSIFAAIELVSLVVFTVEYLLRIWVAAEHLPFRATGRRNVRLAYVLSAAGLVDLLAVLPF